MFAARTARIAIARVAGARSASTGTVKFFNNKKGFGFIVSQDNTEVFVHHTAIQSTGFRTLNQGETVTFESKQTDRGVEATSVADAAGAPFNRPPMQQREGGDRPRFNPRDGGDRPRRTFQKRSDGEGSA